MKGKGFTFKYGNKEVFVITEKKNKTQKLAKEILRKMLLPDTASAIDAVLWWMQKAEFYTKPLKNGDEFFFIKGDNFNCCGSVENDGLIIIEL